MLMMSVSLKNQVIHAISKSKSIGADKHSAKGKGQAYSGNKTGKIYSYSTYRARQDVAKSFCNYVKDNYPEVRQASQLTAEHAQSWLNHCATTGCSTDTLKSYKSQLNSIEKNINSAYRCNTNLSAATAPKGGTKAIRCNPMKSEHLQALKDSYRPYSTGANALTIAEATGARNEEICHVQNRDIHINSDGTATVHIESGKGGRNRDIQVRNPEHVQNLQDLKNHLGASPTERPCPVTRQSLLNNLERHMKSTYTSEGTSIKSQYQNQEFHSIRKMYAQNEYNQCRNEGMSKEQAFQYVTEQLGHNRTDPDLMNRYIANQW